MKVAIVGAGKLGTAIAEAMINGGNDITVVDNSEERIQIINQTLDIFTVAADAKQTETLRDMGIGNYDLLISTTDNDEQNIVICAFAKKLGCRMTVARVRAPEHLEQLDFIRDNMGIDYVINPDKACADEIFKYITQQYALSGGRLSKDGVGVLEFQAGNISGVAGNLLKDVKLPESGLLIAAISRQGKIIIPNGSTQILADDIVYAIGLQASVDALEKHVKQGREIKKVNRVMIAGGGNTGYFLASQLVEYGAAVKIIELDRERCDYLSAELNKVLVLNADATDTAVLREENLAGMDAFVALTGFDEENLLLSLIAKQCGVEKIIAKTSRKSYESLIEQLGDIMIINPLNISATDILHKIRKDGVVLFSKVINGQAEFREIMAEKNMLLTSKTLLDLDIPDGVLLAAVERDGETFIPNGSTKIQEGDKVLILSLLSSSGALENLLSKGKSTIL